MRSNQRSDSPSTHFEEQERQRKLFYGIAAVIAIASMGAMTLYGVLQLTAA